MRIAFFGQSGPYAPLALRELVQHEGLFRLELVVEGRKHPAGRNPHVLRMPRPGPLPTTSELSDLAAAAGVASLITSDVNADGALEHIRAYRPELIVCVGFDRLFSPELLALAERGGINAHPSDLPRWRGPSPFFWALKHGETRHTVTLHALDRFEDHGPIYAKEHFSPPALSSGEYLFALAGGIAGRLLATVLDRAAGGPLRGEPQEHALATRARRPKPEDAFVEPGEWRCEALVRFACAAPYFRAPWLRLGDETFHVRRGERAELGKRIPGDFVQQGRLLLVQCADGVAWLEIQV